MSAKVLLLAHSPLHRDPRVQVQYAALREHFQVLTAGLTPLANADVPFFSLNPFDNRWLDLAARGAVGVLARRPLALMGQHSASYFSQVHVRLALSRLAETRPDLILCNDVDMLPAAARLAERTRQASGFRPKIYLDAHEYTPRQRDSERSFQAWIPYWDSLLRTYAAEVDHMTTVCQSIADEYKAHFGLNCQHIVHNAPPRHETLVPSSREDGLIRLVHHGVASRLRETEVMLDILDGLDERFKLDFYLLTHEPLYLKHLKTRARDNPRVTFHAPVPTSEIVSTIHQYDIGLFPLAPHSTNYRFALPNKFFEFIQARLGVAIWPSVEMKRIADEGGFGVVTEDFSVAEMITRLNALTLADVARLKQKAHEASPRFTSERSQQQILEGCRSLLS